MRRLSAILAALTLALSLLAPHTAYAAEAPNDGFFLHDGDTVVFYGDSITEQQSYARDIENYVVTRFPRWHVRFINSGWSGDRVTGGGGGSIETRIKRDVLPYRPTVVTLFLGMNDGTYTSFDEGIFKTYSEGLAHIVDELRQKLPGVRLTLLTPSMFDYAAKDRPEKPANTGYNYVYPAPDYNQVLIRYGDFVKKLGAGNHIPVADLNAPMMEATAKGRMTDPKFALSGDGVHPNEAGHLIMAASVLKAWHAPAQVADIDLNASKSVTLLTPLPWPVPTNAVTAFTVSPLPGSLDVYHIHASGLAEGDYALKIDGQPAGSFTSRQLAAGVDLDPSHGLPGEKQAQAEMGIAEDRIMRWHFLWKGSDQAIARADDEPTPAEVKALLTIDAWLNAWRVRASAAAQPTLHTFELSPAQK